VYHKPFKAAAAGAARDAAALSPAEQQQAARDAKAFDIAVSRLQLVVDRTISVCKQRVLDIVEAARVHSFVPPPAVKFLKNIVGKCDAHLASVEELSATAEGGSRAVVLQGQWDTCANVRETAVRALEAAVLMEAGTAAGARDGRHALARKPIFRGVLTAADDHEMHAFAAGGESPLRDSPSQPRRQSSYDQTRASPRRRTPVGIRSDSAFDGAKAESACSNLGSAKRYAGSPRGGAPQRQALPVLGSPLRLPDGSVESSPPLVQPAAVQLDGFRGPTKWARYYPPAPLKAHVAHRDRGVSDGRLVGSAAAAVTDAALERNASRNTAGGGGGSEAGDTDAGGGGAGAGAGRAKKHMALLTALPPSDLLAIGRHRRLFLAHFGHDEGTVRFNLWLTSQTPQWAAAFEKTLEENDLNLTKFLVQNS
jgi:hypothetical protein